LKNKQCGFEPTDSATLTKDFFLEKNIKDILIPGIGYGRNAKVFIDNGINVTGIEISKTAIELARQNGLNIPIFHGSVTDMPFDNKLYDGIFSFALLHLLN
jgi:2-polyprenyl-3-methyl-5-hydroxy-6-metoxy-1,4-benzoquinol methylase